MKPLAGNEVIQVSADTVFYWKNISKNIWFLNHCGKRETVYFRDDLIWNMIYNYPLALAIAEFKNICSYSIQLLFDVTNFRLRFASTKMTRMFSFHLYDLLRACFETIFILQFEFCLLVPFLILKLCAYKSCTF